MKSLTRAVLAAVGSAGIALSAGGCSTDSAGSAPTGSAVPTGADLVGTWNQDGVGYERGGPIVWEDQTLVVEEADGQGFSGYKEYTREGEPPTKESVIGVIGYEGTVLIIDDDGNFRGRLEGDVLRGQYAEVGDDPAAVNVEMTKR